MPIDPTIPLMVGSGGSGSSSAASNPLDIVSKFATVQNELNKNRLFEQTYSARQLAGQIMSKAPDIESGFKEILSSPAAPFMGEFLSQMRQSQLTQTQMEGERQKQGMDALTYAQKMALPASLTNPASLDSNYMAALRLTAPAVQEKVLSAINDQRTALLHGLPTDTSTWTNGDFATYTKRAASQALGTGTPVDAIHTIVGQPKLEDVGYGKMPVWTPGLQSGIGAPTVQTGNVFGMGSPAKIIEGPEGPMSVPAITGDNRLLGNIPGQNQQPATGGSVPSANAPVNQVPPTPAEVPAAITDSFGSQVEAPNVPVPNVYKGQFGVLTPQMAGQKAEMLKDHVEKGRARYEAAQKAVSSLDTISRDLDTLSADGTGGLLSPGPLAPQLRRNIVGMVNNAAEMMGNKPVWDPEKYAATESWAKESSKLTLASMVESLGVGREAVGMYRGVESGIPQFSNSILGTSLVLNTSKAMQQREMDKYKFLDNYQARNGHLWGAEAEFDRLYPTKKYVDRAFAQTGYGLTPSGFKSIDDIVNATMAGKLTQEQGEAALKEFRSKQREGK